MKPALAISRLCQVLVIAASLAALAPIANAATTMAVPVTQMQEYAQVVAAEAEANKASSDPSDLIASMLKVTEVDKIMVQGGTAPPTVLIYDAQLLRLFSQHPATLAEHQRDPEWNKRKHALFAARDATLQTYSNAVMQQNQQEQQQYQDKANAGGNGHPNSCIGPMGQDVCHPKKVFRGWCPGQPVNGFETWEECPPGVRCDGYQGN
ncbi:hypothetical protein [Rhodanobacter hydrolyticus]|uniref:Uncharacterized protein n=1 Tax=Rhodanobacter hydrolyticus TaxID=2250595 RepID=A0ABW8J8P8_9GAMM